MDHLRQLKRELVGGLCGPILAVLVTLVGASCTTTPEVVEQEEDAYEFPAKDKDRDVHELVRQSNFKEIVHAYAWDRESINRLDAEGRTPLDLVLLTDDAVTYVKMRKMGAVTTNLHFEAHAKNLGQFTWIAENRPESINRPDKTGKYPLHRAATMAEPRYARVLLKHGAKTDVVDNAGKTPLHHAAMAANVAVVAALLDHGAAPNVVDDNGKTPLDYALALEPDNNARNCQVLLQRAGGTIGTQQ